MSRKTASNTVMLVLGSEVVARFEYGSEVEDGPVNPSAKAKAFLMAVLSDQSHALHEALMAGKVEMFNAHPEVLAPKSSITL